MPRGPSAWRSRCATRFAALSADWRRRGHVLEIGIGIATGYATLGRIGFEGRYDYGAVGNASSSMAARLSGDAAPGRSSSRQRTFAAAEEASGTDLVPNPPATAS